MPVQRQAQPPALARVPAGGPDRPFALQPAGFEANTGLDIGAGG